MRLLCATDLLSKSDGAIQRAGMLSDQLGADLTLLHVVAPAESQQAVEQALQSASSEMQARVRAPRWRAQTVPAVAVHAGTAAKMVLETAAQTRARLLVLGPHGKRPLRDALEGTLAEKALASRNYPVLVVRDAALQPYRRVLLALDASDSSASAVHAAEALVVTSAVEAMVVHAHKPPYEGMLHSADVGMESVARYAELWRREARHSVRELLRFESDDATQYEIHVEQRPAAAGILRAIEYFAPDLLVMGTRGGGRLRRALVGSVANRVLHETRGDVLIVPEGAGGAPRSKLIFGGQRSPRNFAQSGRGSMS